MVSLLVRFSLPLAIVCALAGILSGLGYRWGWWSLEFGFTFLKWSAYAAIAVAAFALASAFASWRGGMRQGLGLSLAALIVAMGTFGVPAAMLYKAKELPPIHDITTDMANPPRFVAILPLRAAAPNSAEYGGPSVAAQQRRAYPQIVPFDSNAAPDKASSRALKVAREMGWTIVAAVPAQGRIEAIDSTLLYGFKDDIVIRVTPTPQGSRTDIRSESRVGEGDIGTNTRRIANFLAKLAKEP